VARSSAISVAAARQVEGSGAVVQRTAGFVRRL
jgi:hypothetical protein